MLYSNSPPKGMDIAGDPLGVRRLELSSGLRKSRRKYPFTICVKEGWDGKNFASIIYFIS